MSYLLLTTKPKQRLLSMDHPEWLYFLPTEDKNSAYLRGKYNYTNGQASHKNLVSLGDIRQDEAQWVNISFAKIDYNGIADQDYKSIELFINTSGNNTKDESIVIVPVRANTESAIALYYHNSMGGLDSFICTGEQSESHDLFYTPTRKPIELETVSGEVEREYFDVNQEQHTFKEVFSGNKPKGEIKALNDFFLIRRGYELKEINGVETLVPIKPIANSFSKPNERSMLHRSSFSYQYAFTERAIDQVVV